MFVVVLAIGWPFFPESPYWYLKVGKIEHDQIEDYAARKGWDVKEAERWLMPILNYIPTANTNRPVATPVADGDAALASHPPGCGCALHLRLRQKAARS